MPYVRLGSSGLKVSKIILGCMSYGTPEWQTWVLPEEESINHINAAYNAGINAFDTANAYSNGQSEVVLGKAIKQLDLPRDKIVVMTKVFAVVGKSPTQIFYPGVDVDAIGYVNQHGLSRKHIFDSLDYINFVAMIGHRFDPETPIEETMQALHDVVQAEYGHQYYAIKNHLTPFISMQNHYNLVYREEEREMFHTLKYFGVASIPWSPLARRLVTRPLGAMTDTTRGKVDRMLNGYNNGQGTRDIVSVVEKIAKARGLSMAHVSLAWVLSKPGVSAPIVGTTSLDNLNDLLGAVNVKLTEEEIKELEAPYLPQAAFGHN
ncbi:Aldo/keto reductase [Pholiota conissans]|uniref:Aldo/keto reductase n=1 Tax=Pholiota conissans TaxID=109636 RepID=A0A9P5ZBE9_9AGAR|nr:Aldo/keto reductase [Pholiota conissans]